MSTIGVAIIGCGGITLQNHLPGLALCPDVKVVALCDVNPASLETARQQTGIDPFNPTAPAAAPSGESSGGAKGGGAKGAAGGAAAGAAVGAIAGDAGQGAAIGATAGAMKGRRDQKKGEKEAQAQQEQQAQAAVQQQGDTFRRAMSACLDARGYSVK